MKKSKVNKYEILVVENRGRDVLPLMVQLKDKINKYKYFCHLHTKKSNDDWRKYLWNNLLGKDIIQETSYNFESSEKLGLIFPPTYVVEINYTITELRINTI